MLNKVRRELEKVQKYILENEEAFGQHNLKLYDLFNQVSNQEMDKFYNFCEFYSEDFNNLLEEPQTFISMMNQLLICSVKKLT